jgi:hypothetical protein
MQHLLPTIVCLLFLIGTTWSIISIYTLYRQHKARKRLNDHSINLSNPFEQDDSWRFEDPYCVESSVFTDEELDSLDSFRARRADKLVKDYFNELDRSRS